jgi:hypothetical protein
MQGMPFLPSDLYCIACFPSGYFRQLPVTVGMSFFLCVSCICGFIYIYISSVLDGYLLSFCDVSFFTSFPFVGLFKFFGVSLVMVWCVSCAGGVFRVPVLYVAQ